MVARADRNDIGIAVIDVQPFFLDLVMPDSPQQEPLLVRLEHLLMLADWMDLPTLATFELPTASNGELPDRLERVLPAGAHRFEKDHFGSLSEPDIAAAFEGMGVKQIAVAGAETDVCILQTTLGLLDKGFEVFLLEDCLFTTESNPGPALRRMYAAGAVPTTVKILAYELVARVTDMPWYPEDWALGQHPDAKPFPEGFVPPEQWPPWNARI
jgi:isochorismate hydrolase